MRTYILASVVLALAACHQSLRQHGSNDAADMQPSNGIKGVHREFYGRPAPTAGFSKPDGTSITLASFRGKPVLVNLWASWCAPCVKELPTLDKLASTGRIGVIAVSEDTGPHASVVAFMKDHQIATLKSYQDPNTRLSGALGPDAVLPTSILFNANGKEVWRYIGDQDWMSPGAAKLLSEVSAQKKD